MAISELLSNIPQNEYVSNEADKELVIDLSDAFELPLGVHYGRIRSFERFTSKDQERRYFKLTIGAMKKINGKEVVFDVERVWLAHYTTDSQLISTMTQLGAVENRSFYPERLLNKAVRFVNKKKGNALQNSYYQTMIADIELVDSIPEEYDFKYVKTYAFGGFEYVPVSINAQKSTNKDSLDIKAGFFDGFEDEVKFD